uniref:rRNA biogenesis protein RRP36 n=1 Tax=Paramormyrops kingsleyae TaxID=1676925 RepID=A0A3B3RKD0_9TELE|nr:ribosomal RNA processing protein 36 homolog [Paramormyrops kingsleyae]XP_023680802.1 ribosomal RNA processing protein 36 homolog [Paramormyrops kingsleyae]
MAPKMKAASKKRKVNRVAGAGVKGLGAIGDSDSEQELERNFALIERRDPEGRQETGGEAGDEPSGSEGCSEDGDVGEDQEVDPAETSEDDDGASEECVTDSDSDGAAGPDSEPRARQSEEDIKKELSAMSFEEIMKLQNKVGTKVFNEVAYGTKKKQGAEKGKKRLNKNRPMEVSAKQSVPFLRHVVPVKKKMPRDPRFDDLSGEYKPEIFEKTYSFIKTIKQKEKELVQKKIKKVKSMKKKEQLDHLLKRMVDQERAQKQRELQREKELEHKRRQRELVKQGHRPFFLKKSDKRKLELAEKYSDLKRSGKLENFLSKKRKRNAMKDRRKMPLHQKAQ